MSRLHWSIGSASGSVILGRLKPFCHEKRSHRPDWDAMAYWCRCGRFVCGWCEGGTDTEDCDRCWSKANPGGRN